MGVNTWLMKGFFDTIPKDLDESAKVDGATHAQIFFGIILPLVTPILAITGLLSFIGDHERVHDLQHLPDPGRRQDRGGRPVRPDRLAERNTNFGIFAAGALIVAIPTVALFQFLQRYIVGGITAGAVKG